MNRPLLPSTGSNLPATSDPRGGALGMPDLPPPEEPAAAESGLNLGRLRAAIVRFRWLILTVLVLGTTASIAATKVLTPAYQVGATIWINRAGGQKGPLQPEELLSSRNWVELLTTYVVLDPVVTQERLYLQPSKPSDFSLFDEFRLASAFAPGRYTLEIDGAGKAYRLRREGGLYEERGQVGDSIGRRPGFLWAPKAAELGRDRKIQFNLLTPREASIALIERLNPALREGGEFLRLTLTGEDPARTASTMNRLADRFVEVASELQKNNLIKVRQALEEQVAQAQTNLTEAERTLEGYRVSTITLPGEQSLTITPGLQSTQTPALKQYFDQKTELDQTRRDRRAVEDVLRQAEGNELAVDAFQTIGAVRQAPDLTRVLGELSTSEAERRSLLQRYTPEYRAVKDLDDRIATLRTRVIPAYATALVQRLKEIESDLEARIGNADRELRQIPVRTMTEDRYRRDAEAKRALFLNLQARYEEAKLSELSAIPEVSIHDTAVAPTRPSKNTAPRIILMGMAVTIGLAFALAILLDRVDPRFRYPEQATSELGLTILGAIPEIKHARNGRGHGDDVAQVIEAFRSIRLNLAHSFDPSGPITFTVSSPGPGDGKSLVSTNLALSFAQAGYRTLLIDGDTRRGELHRIFHVERRPGLLDFLQRHTSLDTVLRPTSHEQLTLIPCGSRRQSGPELLGSAAMTQMLSDLRERFEVIVVDSPPLGAGVDPFVLATHTGNLLIVLRAGETDREMAETRLKLVDRLPIRLLGAVLNDFRTAGGVYKYYSYLSGYAAEEEGDESVEEPPRISSSSSKS